ncbi:MAG: 4Fe-4S dicluster domain-containing protein [Candidatus Hodarchaeota archaeon]
MVKFYYDNKKCELLYDQAEYRPTKCLKCLDICPYSLLMFVPMKEMRKDGAPSKFKIHLTFRSYADKFCPECLKCVEECPSNAIKIKI